MDSNDIRDDELEYEELNSYAPGTPAKPVQQQASATQSGSSIEITELANSSAEHLKAQSEVNFIEPFQTNSIFYHMNRVLQKSRNIFKKFEVDTVDSADTLS